ncbi:sigma-70 family RNA polymerase sigma factor [Pseudalkalibacillus hwajinpoensis]|uniref:sigma-70 family RNA polymerase sigma factor n=1 Tax=Guptibacillus hwajinpoensis TaxID=208199 RepID=UPI00325A47ED
MEKSGSVANLIQLRDKEDLIEDLMESYGESLTRLAYTYVKDWHQAENVIQDVFVSFYLKLDTYRAETSLKTWLYRIAIYRCHDYIHCRFLHSFTLSQLTTFLTGVPVASLQLSAKDEYEELSKNVLSLPVKYREVIVLLYDQAMNVAEVSTALHCSQSVVKTRLHRARKILSKELALGITSMDDEIKHLSEGMNPLISREKKFTPRSKAAIRNAIDKERFSTKKKDFPLFSIIGYVALLAVIVFLCFATST